MQCGFCMPGMVMSAKALLDAKPAPTAAEVKSAIRYNLCRCTGYTKVEQAIQLVAKALRNGETPEVELTGALVGERMVRLDAKEKFWEAANLSTTCRLQACCMVRCCAQNIRALWSKRSTWRLRGRARRRSRAHG